jgi:hypothetical protein
MELSKPFLPEYRIDDPKKKSADDPAEDNLAPLKYPFGEEIRGGSFAKIHGLYDLEGKDTKWLAKEADDKYSPPFFNRFKINFSREKFSNFLEKILGPGFKIKADKEFIKNGLLEYVLIKKYFGSNADAKSDQNKTETDSEAIGEIKENAGAQIIRELQDENSVFFKELLNAAGGKEGIEKISEVMEKNKDYNFLPKEHLVVGHPSSLSRQEAEDMQARGEKLPMTYYIIQEWIKGEEVAPLFEMDDEELEKHPAMVEKLLTFLVLAKKMYIDTGKLIDTRPEEVGKHPLEWFNKTGNILVDKKTDQVHFVDTRWLWDKKSRLGEGGLNIIKLLFVGSIDKSIEKYTAMLTRIELNQ